MIYQGGPCHKEDLLFPGMDLMVIVFLVLTLVTKRWIVHMGEGVSKDKMSRLDAGHATKLDTLLPTATL